MRLTLLVVMLLLSSCFTDKTKWPYRMTPFFAECPYEEGTFVDEDDIILNKEKRPYG